MNQILETKLNSGPKPRKTDNSKVKIIFATLIILFSIAIISVAGYSLYNKYVIMPNNKQEKPAIKLEQLNETNIRVLIEYDGELKKVAYQWDDGDVTETITTGKEVQKLLQIPSENGIHTLTVKAYAEDGTKNEIEKEYEYNGQVEPEPEPQPEPEPEPEYKEPPTIARTVDTINKLVNFEVTDDRGIDYIVYNWQDEPEIMLQADPNNNKKIEASIEVNRGENILTVKAVDIDGNETIKTATFKGLKVPEISVIKYDDTVRVNVSHDMGFEKVEFIINGKVYIYDELCEIYNPEQTLLEYIFDLQEGENTVNINAYSLEGTIKYYSGRCSN